jgi:hypothetical protein
MSAQKKSKSKSKKTKNLSAEEIRQKLKVKHLEVKKKLSTTYPKVDKFFKDKSLDPGKIRQHSAKILSAGMIAGSLLLSSGAAHKALPAPHEFIDKLKDGDPSAKAKSSAALLIDTLRSVLPERPRPLTRDEEKLLEQVFTNVVGIPAKATLEGEHLNTTYGYIGAEQHLRRYPGDTLRNHGEPEMLDLGHGDILHHQRMV